MRKRKKDVQNLISQYKAASKKNQSRVIYCFDCDNFDTNAEDENFLKNAKQYCEEKMDMDLFGFAGILSRYI